MAGFLAYGSMLPFTVAVQLRIFTGIPHLLPARATGFHRSL